MEPEEIMNELLDILSEATWISEETKKQIKELKAASEGE